MNISAPFIHRPVATTLLTLGLLLAGMFAFPLLAVSPLPLVGFYRYREIAPVIQYQLAQRGLREIEARLVVERPLIPTEESARAKLIQESLGHPFDSRFVYHSHRIPVAILRTGSHSDSQIVTYCYKHWIKFYGT